MAETLGDNATERPTAGKRRPVETDIPAFMEHISEGLSLRAACKTLGIHAPSMQTFIDENEGRREHYARAREMRAEHYQEESLTVTKAAALGVTFNGKKVDPMGARVYLDAIKWATARMAPKTAPVQRFDVTTRVRQMTDAELAEEIAALEATLNGED